MKVLLDGRKLGDGGIGTYIENLVAGLLESNTVSVTVLSSRERAARTAFVGDVGWVYEEAERYSLDEMVLMPRRIDFRGFDLFHTPHYMLPFGIPIPTVVTVHDLIHITHPQRVYYPWMARWLIGSAARRASAVIAVSNDTRRAVLELAHVNASKVVHVPNSISSLLVEPGAASKAISTKRYCDLSPYFLAVLSNVKPHKALPDLISAFKAFRESKDQTWEGKLPRAPRLVITGFGTEQLLQSDELLRLFGDSEGVQILGPVSHDDLGCLYRKALAVVIPSLAEGFCLPALEAQSVGTPVVCRPVPALLELVTDKDIVAADMSVEALVDGLAVRAAQGLDVDHIVPQAHLDRYSPLRVAQHTIEVYRKVCATNGASKRGAES